MDRAQVRNLAPFLEDLSQSEILSEIKPHLKTGICWKSLAIYAQKSFHRRYTFVDILLTSIGNPITHW